MSQENVKFDVNNVISLEYSRDVKEEFHDEFCPDNKVCVTETTINISNTDLNEYMTNNKIRKYDTFPVDYIKTDLQSYEVNDTLNNNVKMEDGICAGDIQIEFDDQLLLCNHCHEDYQDYCTKCRVLVHILNERPCSNTCNRIRELPKYMLETRGFIGHVGIFSLKVIPEDVRFGPFTGLNSAGLSLRIKGGSFVVSDDKVMDLNWMQYINPARSIYEHNLFPFQYEDKLYYYSTRRIQAGEQLLVYFGKKYEDNLFKNVEMDFFPTTKNDVENVFACIFCCLGFRSKEYLAEHKSVCHSETSKMLSVEELAQCPFCKIYVETKEYLEHHKDYCCETNARCCLVTTPEVSEIEIEGRSKASIKNMKERSPHLQDDEKQCRPKSQTKHLTAIKHKCMECEYKTNRKSQLENHVKAKHLEQNDYKCVECEFKTNIKPNLAKHIKRKHLEDNDYKCVECEFKTNYKNNLPAHVKAKHPEQNGCKCTVCGFESSYKSSLQAHIKAKHPEQNDYKCTNCEFKTNNMNNLRAHVKAKHLRRKDYKCMECEYRTYYQSALSKHIKRKHLQQNDYNCAECEFKTNIKSYLQVHIRARHLKENDYKCMNCDYETNYKACLKRHIKTNHLRQSDYKCAECEFMTNNKSYLQVHIKVKHLKEKDYKCTECEYKTNYKSYLRKHIKAKHLKENE